MSGNVKSVIATFLNARYQLQEKEIDWEGPINETVYIDSLGMIDFLSYLEKELSVDLPLIDLLENFPPTLVALIECIDERKQ